MDDLKAAPPCAGLLPIEIAGCRLAETDLGCLTMIAPFAGQQAAVAGVLAQAHGLAFPALNRAEMREQARVLWFGRETVLLTGATPDPALQDLAALTDQSDAWACVTLTGPDACAVLARLVPVDLRLERFGMGSSIRTLLGHMNVSITRLDEQTLLLLVFRSMAHTMVEELKEALEAVAARR